MKKLKEYLDTKKKKNPLQERLEKYKKKEAVKTKEVTADTKEVTADTKEVTADTKEVTADTKEVTADTKEVMDYIVKSFQDMEEKFNLKFKEEIAGLVNALELEPIEEASPGIEKPKDTPKDTPILPIEKTKDTNILPNEAQYDVDKNFFLLAQQLRIPKDNHETLLFALKGKGSLSDVKDTESLTKIINENLKQMPLFQRSTQYKTKVANNQDSTPKPDFENMSLAERKNRLVASLKSLPI